jgi:hypothetical protein
MAKLNKRLTPSISTSTTGKSPLKVTDKRVTNFQGGDALMYSKKSRLFMMAVNTFSGEASYYNNAATRDAELKELVQLIAVKDPDWMTRFLPWLRTVANIRTSTITIAVDAAMAMLKAGIPGGRQIVDSVLQRADEPGEAVAYFHANYGRKIPKSIKRGVADAATRLYNEFTLLKYDSDSSAVRFADVLELTHPTPGTPVQGSLFKYAIDARHGRAVNDIEKLPMLAYNKLARLTWNIKDATPVIPTPESLKAAGMSWEDVLSALGSKIDKKDLWGALIPNMGYMALIRNLRNFEQAGISKQSARFVQDKLSSPSEVARSKQLPMRFLSAYRNVVSDVFKQSLEEALQESLSNIPALSGRTLILIDTSGSMHSAMSDKSGLMRWDAAVIFGLALASRCTDVQVVSFSDAQRGYSFARRGQTSGEASKVFPAVKGESLLRGIDRWEKGGFFIGAGTDTAGAVARHFNGQDRVVILTDEESQTGDVYRSVPDSVIKIDINLAGYGHSHTGKETRNLIKLAGLTDAMFTLIPSLEAGLNESWPF